MNSLKCISPLDGRYYTKTKDLTEIFSEYALIKSRVHVEIDYFVFILENILKISITQETRTFLNDLGIQFSVEDAYEIKEIEKTTNHDVKAVEYFLKKKFENKKLAEFNEFVHFGLTSQDINSVSYVVQIKHLSLIHI